MTTYGKAREETINALIERKPLMRSGFGMKAFNRATELRGRLPEKWVNEYAIDELEGIVYTVVSYMTPIAWVKRDGTVVIPDIYYSPTTSAHQGLCRTYLTSGKGYNT